MVCSMAGQYARQAAMLFDSRLALPELIKADNIPLGRIRYTTHKKLPLAQPSWTHLALHSFLALDNPPAIGFRAMHL